VLFRSSGAEARVKRPNLLQAGGFRLRWVIAAAA
jgi:hypothetical protein